jgi:alkyl hydroperoxide reductase 1
MENAEFKNKKAVIVSVPGAFTPTCQNTHITGYLSKLSELKAKADIVIVIAFNDPFVMAAWGKANGIKDDSIVSPLPLSL